MSTWHDLMKEFNQKNKEVFPNQRFLALLEKTLTKFDSIDINNILLEVLDLIERERDIEKDLLKKTSSHHYIRASSIGYCPQSILFMLQGKKSKPSNSLLRKFHNGSFAHIRIQSYLLAMSKFFPDEIKIIHLEPYFVSERYNICGHVDAIISIDTEDYIVEFKTINHEEFQGLFEVKAEHYLQAHAYALMTGIERILLLYEDKNNQNWKCFYEQYDCEIADTVIKPKIKTILQAFANNETLQRYDGSSDSCKYCLYKSFCKQLTLETEESDIYDLL